MLVNAKDLIIGSHVDNHVQEVEHSTLVNSEDCSAGSNPSATISDSFRYIFIDDFSFLNKVGPFLSSGSEVAKLSEYDHEYLESPRVVISSNNFDDFAPFLRALAEGTLEAVGIVSRFSPEILGYVDSVVGSSVALEKIQVSNGHIGLLLEFTPKPDESRLRDSSSFFEIYRLVSDLYREELSFLRERLTASEEKSRSYLDALRYLEAVAKRDAHLNGKSIQPKGNKDSDALIARLETENANLQNRYDSLANSTLGKATLRYWQKRRDLQGVLGKARRDRK